jgi:hypothetical protein
MSEIRDFKCPALQQVTLQQALQQMRAELLAA